jgi:hypothetical protein
MPFSLLRKHGEISTNHDWTKCCLRVSLMPRSVKGGINKMAGLKRPICPVCEKAAPDHAPFCRLLAYNDAFAAWLRRQARSY